MVTAMEDACPNGVREEEGQLADEGPPPAAQPTQGPDSSGGEERRRCRTL